MSTPKSSPSTLHDGHDAQAESTPKYSVSPLAEKLMADGEKSVVLQVAEAEETKRKISKISRNRRAPEQFEAGPASGRMTNDRAPISGREVGGVKKPGRSKAQDCDLSTADVTSGLPKHTVRRLSTDNDSRSEKDVNSVVMEENGTVYDNMRSVATIGRNERRLSVSDFGPAAITGMKENTFEWVVPPVDNKGRIPRNPRLKEKERAGFDQLDIREFKVRPERRFTVSAQLPGTAARPETKVPTEEDARCKLCRFCGTRVIRCRHIEVSSSWCRRFLFEMRLC